MKLFPRLTAVAVFFSLAACNNSNDTTPVPADSTTTVTPSVDNSMNGQGMMTDTTGTMRSDTSMNNNRMNNQGNMNDTGRTGQNPPR